MMRPHLDIMMFLCETSDMRTTVSIDDDLLAAAKCLARAQSLTLGQVLSDLARRGLTAGASADFRVETGFPIFRVSPGARPITLEDVRKAEDEA